MTPPCRWWTSQCWTVSGTNSEKTGVNSKVFVGNFIECLPQRLSKLRLALTTGDLEGSVDAVLSLKTSSQMVGAERLAGLATNLESEISGNQEQRSGKRQAPA